MRFENPFFTREARALARRQFAPLSWLVVLQVLVPVIPLLVLERLLGGTLDPPEFRRGMALAVLGTFHAVLCGVSGWMMGIRVFTEEHRQSTLEDVRLIAQSPLRWLGLKLVFPIYGILATWAACIPSYLAVALRGHFLPRELAPGALLALSAGVVGFGAALLAPAERQRLRLSSTIRISPALLLAFAQERLLPWTAGFLLLRLGWRWVQAAATSDPNLFPPQPYYGTSGSPVEVFALLLGALIFTALLAAFATADPAGSPSARIAGLARVASPVAVYYVFLGFDWHRIPREYGPMWLAVVPVSGLVLWLYPRLARCHRARRARKPADDALAVGELGWLERAFDNPVLIRDLRVALRPYGLRKRFLMVLGALVLAMVLLGGLSVLPTAGLAGMFVRGAPALTEFLARIVIAGVIGGIWLVVPGLLTFGARALRLWHAERRADTLSHLFASPVMTETLVRGRWGAALLVGLSGIAPVVLCFTVSLGTVLLMQQALQAFNVLAPLGVWVASMGLVLSVGFAGGVRTVVRFRDLWSPVPLAFGVVLSEGVGLVVLVNSQLPGAEPLILFSLSLVVVNALLTWAIYRRAVSDLEELRHQDVG